ncbi:hypothetical protein T03_3047 [Trichinella britovi]|uniref:UmuC domain-containing protein n=1 Tax=Trichinella britovi TaxID=45882 RepID=A0A0V1CGL9_TRIBR|nr:hypothetical protein T03_3047 [Trichinella britovi]
MAITYLCVGSPCGTVDVAGQSMQGCNRNSGRFSACTQPAESSGAGVGRKKVESLPLVPLRSHFMYNNQHSYIGIFPIRYQAISAKSERLTMRLEDAHGRMDPFAVMELSDDGDENPPPCLTRRTRFH